VKQVKQIVLPLCCLLLCIACTTGKQEVELLNEFVIAAYSGPPPEEVTLERYREMAEAGIDVIVPGNGTMNGEQNLKAMDLAAEVGIRVIPVDTRVMPFAQTAGIRIDTAVILEMVSDYRDHPAFAGYVVRDEPPASLFPSLRELCNLFRELDPDHEPLINLFPSYASTEQLGSPDYRTHIRDYLATVEPGLLSYDNYALRGPATWYDYWFNDLELVREETRKAGIPFWVFIQSEGIGIHMRVPNRAEVLWQVNTAVAYGARGLGWFTYWTPPTDQGIPQVEGAPPPLIEEHHGAMLDIHGNRTDLYDHVREANLYIKEVGRGLTRWENAFVARYEDGQMQAGGASPLLAVSGENAHLVIGTFTREKRARVVIANSRCETPAGFSLNLTGGRSIRGVVASMDASPGKDNDDFREWILEPGGSVILEIK
jgi:hypothetical protein